MPKPVAEIKQVTLKKFSMATIASNSIIVLIGKRKGGKSSLVLDFLSYHTDIPVAMVISPTDEFNHTFRGVIPEIFIHHEFNPTALNTFLKRQQEKTKRSQIDGSDPRALLILDDIMGEDDSWSRDSTIKWLFLNGRHVNVTLVVALQDVIGLPPKMRNNTDYIFICKQTNRIGRERIYRMFAGVFDNIQLFEHTMLHCCDDYRCLVIDNTSQSYNLEDQVFWYKADINRAKSAKVCHPKYWELNDELKLVEKDSEDKPENIKNCYNRASGQTFVIRRLE